MIHTKANLISPKFEQQLDFSFSSMLNARTKRERESSRPTSDFKFHKPCNNEPWQTKMEGEGD